MFGMKREVVGVIVSISCEFFLGVILEKYGINLLEGSGVFGIYLMGIVFGIIYFSVLGLIFIYSGFYLYVLGMVCGVGSGSMMIVVVGLLFIMVLFEMVDIIFVYVVISNMMFSIIGIIFLVFVFLLFINFMYKILELKFLRNKKIKEIKFIEGEC